MSKKIERHFDETPDKAGYALPCEAEVTVEQEIQGHIMRMSCAGVYDKRKVRYGNHTQTVRGWEIQDGPVKRSLLENERVTWWYVPIPKESDDNINNNDKKGRADDMYKCKLLKIEDLNGYDKLISDIESEGRYYDMRADEMRDQLDNVEHTDKEKKLLKEKYIEYHEKACDVYDSMLDILKMDPEAIGERGWTEDVPKDAKVVIIREKGDCDYEGFIIMTVSSVAWYRTVHPKEYEFYTVL